MSAMERRDAVIVGGGPAGSTLARALVRAGANVTVLDKRTFPRDKTCAGWITPAVIGSLGLDLEEYRRRGRVLQPIHGFRVARMGAAPLHNDHGPAPVSYAIRRCEFDHFLLARSGAELRTGAPLESLARDDGGWIERRIFPGAQPPSLGQMMAIFEPRAFSVLDVENLRLHYAETLRHWTARYLAAIDAVSATRGAEFARAWQLYLAGSTAAFTTGTMQLFQVLFARGRNNDLPASRRHLYP